MTHQALTNADLQLNDAIIEKNKLWRIVNTLNTRLSGEKMVIEKQRLRLFATFNIARTHYNGKVADVELLQLRVAALRKRLRDEEDAAAEQQLQQRLHDVERVQIDAIRASEQEAAQDLMEIIDVIMGFMNGDVAPPAHEPAAPTAALAPAVVDDAEPSAEPSQPDAPADEPSLEALLATVNPQLDTLFTDWIW